MEDLNWTKSVVAGIGVSVACMLPTVVTALIIAGMFALPIGTTILLAASGVDGTAAGGSGGTLLAFTTLGSIVASLPVSMASVLLHPIGGATALFAYRRGARRTGIGLMLAHGVTFVAGAAVALSWSSFVVDAVAR